MGYVYLFGIALGYENYNSAHVLFSITRGTRELLEATKLIFMEVEQDILSACICCGNTSLQVMFDIHQSWRYHH